MNTNPELLPTYKSLSPVLRTQTTSEGDLEENALPTVHLVLNVFL